MLWKRFSESLTQRVKSFSQSVSDLSLAATTSVTNLNRAAEHFTRIINHAEGQTTSASSLRQFLETVAGDEARTTPSSFDETFLKLLNETVAMLRRLASSLESAKTDVSKRQARLKVLSTQHLTTSGSVSECQHARW